MDRVAASRPPAVTCTVSVTAGSAALTVPFAAALTVPCPLTVLSVSVSVFFTVLTAVTVSCSGSAAVSLLTSRTAVFSRVVLRISCGSVVILPTVL